jgi:predicted  nucleic acid-binding Zn-ribbon protein
MTEIQARIQRLENRLAYVAKESRMDPEGSRRDGAKRMLVHLPYEMKKIEQEIARHRNQIRQLQA